MTITETKTAETTDWIGKARVLAADFATRAAEHDASDAFVAENYRALRAAKLFSAAVPTELGGGGATTPQICEVIRELGHGCGSTALAYSMHAHLIATTVRRYRHGNTPPADSLLRRVAAEELVLVSSGGSDWLESSGTLTKKDGSFVYSGRKLFGSGSPGGDVLVTTGIYNDPEKGEIIRHFAVDLHGPGVRVLDNWRTMGMRGTGSNDIVIENVGVPATFVERPRHKWDRYWDNNAPLIFALISAAYMGVAEYARGIALEAARKKKDDPVTQQLVGEMETELLCARTMYDDMVAVTGSDYTPSIEASSVLFQRRTLFNRSAMRAVQLACDAVGGASFYRSVGIERAFRDIQATRFHPWQERKQYVFSGRIALGLEPV